MIEVKDEILNGEPRYKLTQNDDGTYAIELVTPVIQEGTALNKAFFNIVMPSGLICMWSGSQVPRGWFLCDGKNGTPDLRNRFIVGAGSEYTINSVGGFKETILNANQLPSHVHEIKVNANNSEYYTNKYEGSLGDEEGYVLGTRDGESKLCIPGEDMDTQDLNYDFTIETTANVGGESIDNRPPYYALAYIMKA